MCLRAETVKPADKSSGFGYKVFETDGQPVGERIPLNHYTMEEKL